MAMCEICSRWNKHEINSKEAMVLIGTALKRAKKSNVDHLKALASKILDTEVPFDHTDEQAERAFWKRTHRRKDEEL